MARIYDPGRAEIYQRLGIPTVATVKWTSDQMLRRLLPQGHVPEFTDPSGKVVIAEMPVSPGWIGRRMTDIEAATGGRLAYLTRLGDGMIPGPDTVYQEGDLIHIALQREDLAVAERVLRRAAAGALTCERPSPMRVVIAGAGSVGRSIARELLRNGHHVLLIDRDADGERVQKVPDASWLQADACEIEALSRGRAGRVRRRRRGHRRRQGQPRAVRCWPRPSSACPAPWPGSTTPRTSGCSTRRGASTSPSRRRG